jgi:arsenate reductase
MAEELLRRACPDVRVESAGITPGELNPLAIEVLLEEGIDIRGKKTRDVFEVYKEGHLYSHVITVCDESSAERCPVFPGPGRREHWSFKDPSQFTGTWEERLAQTRLIRDAINERIAEWCAINCSHTIET